MTTQNIKHAKMQVKTSSQHKSTITAQNATKVQTETQKKFGKGKTSTCNRRHITMIIQITNKVNLIMILNL